MTLPVSMDWTYEQAMAAEQEHVPAPGERARQSPFWQWMGLQTLKQLRAEYESGNQNALMGAIAECALASLPIPDWAATAFLKGFYDVTRLRKAGWDEAFGAPHRKGKHLETSRMKLEKTPLVYLRIKHARDSGTSLNEDFFDQVASEFGISRTVCKEMWRDGNEMLNRILPLPPRTGKKRNSRR